MNPDIDRIIFTQQEIERCTDRIARQINADYANEPVIVISVLKGSVLFFSDIVKKLTVPCEIDFIAISSYGNTASSGELRLKKDIDSDIRGKNVIIIEDILDTGKTLKSLCDLLKQRDPKTLKICVLLNKNVKKTCEISADYTGFEVDDAFVVGYGLDYAQKYRNLPYIGALKEEIWKK